MSVSIRRSLGGYPATIASGDIVISNSTASSYTDHNLPNGTYYYSIFAKDFVGNVSLKSTATATVYKPLAPLNVSATRGAGNSVVLSWTFPHDPVAGNKQLQIRKETPDYPGSAISTLHTRTGNFVGGDVGTFTDTATLPGVMYRYSISIQTTNPSRQSTAVMVDMLTPGTPPPTPNVPTSFAATTVGDAIVLTWEKPQDPNPELPKNIYISRKITSAPEVSQITIYTTPLTSSSATQYVDANLVANTPYTYRIHTGYTTPITLKSTQNSADATAQSFPSIEPLSLLNLFTTPEIQSPKITLDAKDHIYTVDSQNGLIKKLTANGEALFSISGLSRPTGFAIDDDGFLYTTEFNGNRVLKFDPDGSNKTVFATVTRPDVVCVDPEGNVYVGTSHDNSPLPQIIKYNKHGAIVSDWGTNGSIAMRIIAIQPDGSGGLYVSALHDGKILHISADGKTVSTVISGLKSPTALTIDNKGNFFVLENGGKVKKYGPNGQALAFYAPSPAPNGYGIAVDATGQVWVSDTYNTRKVYILTQGTDQNPPLPPTNIIATPSGNAVHLSWNNPVTPDFASIQIRKMGGPGQADTLLIDNLEDTSVTLNGLAFNTTHTFRLFAKDAAGNLSTAGLASAYTQIRTEDLAENPDIDSGELVITEEVLEPVLAPKIGTNGTATLNLTNRYTSTGTEIGVNNGAKGTLVLTDSAAVWRDTGDVVIGKSGEGQVHQSRGSVEVTGKIILGQDAGSRGTYTFAGGSLKAGALELTNGGNSTFDWVGGTLETPSVIGDLYNQGGTLAVAPDTPMSIVGSYAQTASGTMSFRVANTTILSQTRRNKTRLQADNNALLSATGTIDAGSGTLTISIDFEPTPGTTVQVFSPAPTGTFSQINLPELNSPLQWDQSALYSTGTLSIVSLSQDILASRPLNAPNPFKLSDGAMLGYYLNAAVDIELRIYKSSGNEVLRTSFIKGVHEGAKAGYNRVVLNRSFFGQDLSAGIYPYLLISDGKIVGKGKMAINPE